MNLSIAIVVKAYTQIFVLKLSLMIIYKLKNIHARLAINRFKFYLSFLILEKISLSFFNLKFHHFFFLVHIESHSPVYMYVDSQSVSWKLTLTVDDCFWLTLTLITSAYSIAVYDSISIKLTFFKHEQTLKAMDDTLSYLFSWLKKYLILSQCTNKKKEHVLIFWVLIWHIYIDRSKLLTGMMLHHMLLMRHRLTYAANVRCVSNMTATQF